MIVVLLIVDDTCTTTQISTKPSPDGNSKVLIEHKACVNEKNDKIIESNNVYIYLQDINEKKKLQIFAGLIKNIEEYSATVDWVSNEDMLISYNGLIPITTEGIYDGISIKYKDKTTIIFSNIEDMNEVKSLNLVKTKYPNAFESNEKVFVSKIKLLDNINDFATIDDNVYEVRVVSSENKEIKIFFVKPNEEKLLVVK